MNKTNVFFSLLAVFCMATSVLQAAQPADTACAICIEDIPTNPVTTTCQHTFCSECLKTNIRQWRNEAKSQGKKCPTCRVEMTEAFMDGVLAGRGQAVAAIAAARPVAAPRPVAPAYGYAVGVADDDEIPAEILALSREMANARVTEEAQLAQALMLSERTHTEGEARRAAMAAARPPVPMPAAAAHAYAPQAAAAGMRTWQCTRCFVQNEPHNDCCPVCLEGGEWIERPTAQVIAAVPAPRPMPMPVPAPRVVTGGAAGGYGVPVDPVEQALQRARATARARGQRACEVCTFINPIGCDACQTCGSPLFE